MTKFRTLGQKAEELYVEEQKTLEEISRIWGVSITTLSRWKKKARWKEKREAYLSFIPGHEKMAVDSFPPEKFGDKLNTAGAPFNGKESSLKQEADWASELVGRPEGVRKRALMRLEILRGAIGLRGKILRQYLKERSASNGAFYRWQKAYREKGVEGLIDNYGRPSKMENLRDLLDMVYQPGKPKKAISKDFITLCGTRGITPPRQSAIRYFIDKDYPSQDIVAEETQNRPMLLHQYRSTGIYDFISTGVQEFDRVLGGGFHIPSSVILAGGPGVGKSTLMLQVVSNLARVRGAKSCLYLSAEQDCSQIKKRIDEIGTYDKFYVDTTDDLERAVQIVRGIRPKLVVVDSIKRMRTTSYTGTYDSPYYMSYCGKQLTRLSKETRASIVLINHMTKLGGMSGLKSLEHDVDAVLWLQGNPLSDIKMLCASKNRYGDTTEVGFFRMTEKGLVEVNDVEYLFRQKRNRKVFGVSLVVVQKGQKILPLEIQSLIGEPVNKPIINATGLDKEQVIKMLRIIKEIIAIDLTNAEVTITTTGEIELDYPYIELAIFSSIMSYVKRVDVSNKVFIGEVDLTGSVRPFYGQKRLLNNMLRIKDIKGIFAPKPVDPVEYLEDERVTYVEDVYSLSEIVFKI